MFIYYFTIFDMQSLHDLNIWAWTQVQPTTLVNELTR